MAEVVYTLLQKGDSHEFHLFECKWSNPEKTSCSIPSKSICNKMARGDRNIGSDGKASSPPFACKDEDSARKACANRGRAVCGICVSSLYRTPED